MLLPIWNEIKTHIVRSNKWRKRTFFDPLVAFYRKLMKNGKFVNIPLYAVSCLERIVNGLKVGSDD